ncbi:hypothetical protein BKN51_15715 [Amycolatopsis sp. BJA-103]|nr:hypothetical protein BKN51_15715 [Amycolatopsis sp. BJA-103]
MSISAAGAESNLGSVTPDRRRRAGSAPIADAEVVVTDGRFSAIRSASDARPVTDGTPVLDGRGGYLVPGLWESHTHLGGFAMFKPENERAKYVSRLLADFLEVGVTTVVDLGGPLEMELAARDYRNKATDSAARLFFAGRCSPV